MAGLVPATSIVLALCPQIRGRRTSPATTSISDSKRSKSGLSSAVLPYVRQIRRHESRHVRIKIHSGADDADIAKLRLRLAREMAQYSLSHRFSRVREVDALHDGDARAVDDRVPSGRDRNLGIGQAGLFGDLPHD